MRLLNSRSLHFTFITLFTVVLRGALPPVQERDIVSGRHSYTLGWDALVPASAGARSKAVGTFFGDVEQVSGFSVGDDPANGVRTINVQPGVTSALLEYKFDFIQTSSRVTRMKVRDTLRLEPEADNWAAITVSWQADGQGPWRELRSLNGTRFAAPPPIVSEVALDTPAAVIRYRVEFASEKPVSYRWGRARWNFLKINGATDSAFLIDFTLTNAGQAAKIRAFEARRMSAGSPWGISAHPLRDTEWDHLETLVERTKEAGMTWLREDFSFPRILTRDGQRDFSKFDILVNQLTQAGVGTVGILNAYDSDLRKKGYGDIVPIYEHPEVWRIYVRAMVGRYHDRVRHWVVWNEQDGGFWHPKPDAAQYVSLLKIAYEEIHRIDPGAKVITGGLEYWNTGYLKDMYLAGAAGYYDIIGVHRYGPGPDASPVVRRTLREFRSLMKEHNESHVPVWILESGGSTFQSPLLTQQPLFLEKAIRYALTRIHRAPAPDMPIIAGLPLSPRVRADQYDEIPLRRTWLPGSTLRLVPFGQLSSLSPDECPVLIMENGLHIDAPLLPKLQEWIKRGGLLVAIGHPPFYVLHTQDANGLWQRRDAVGETYPVFRMGFAASWNRKGIPEQTENVFVPEPALAAGLPPVANIYVKHFFTPDRLKAGDSFIPLLRIRDSSGNPIPDVAAIGLYTYHDWQGALLASTPSISGGLDEAGQAELIPRIYLSYLGTPEAKVERIFIYDLHDDGQKRGEREHNFGLVRWDWTPKPAFHAYAEMTQALGKSPTFVRAISSGDTSSWALLFRRVEDGRLIVAAWTTDAARPFAIEPPADWALAPIAVTSTSVHYHPLPADATNTAGLRIIAK